MINYITIALTGISTATTIFLVAVIYNLPEVYTLSENITTAKCSSDQKFAILYKDDKDSIKKNDEGFDIFGNSIIGRSICGDGVLSITASGSQANNISPIISIISNDEIVANIAVDKEMVVDLPMNGLATLKVAYLNDYYHISSRSIQLSNIRFSGQECSTFSVKPLSSAIGKWFSDKKDIVIVNEGKINFETCSSGALEADYKVYTPDSQTPILYEVKNNNKIPIVDIDGVIHIDVECCSLVLSAAETKVYQVDDRNLFIKNISWSENEK